MTRLLASMLAAVALAACTSHQHMASSEEGPSIRSNPNEPIVDVRPGPVVIVDQDPIYHPRNAPDKSTTWTLTQSARRDWEFVSVNISPGSGGAMPFIGCGPQANGNKFRCDNTGTPGDYKYTITLRNRRNGSTFTSPDPFIRNG